MLAVLGMIIYSWAVESDKQANMKVNLLSRVEQLEEDTSLLKNRANGIEARDVELGQTKSWALMYFARYLFFLLFVNLLVSHNFFFFDL